MSSMANSFDRAAEVARVRRTYTLVGVSGLDARLLTALLGLVQRRLRDDWQPASDEPVDLVIIGNDASEDEYVRWSARGVHRLMLAHVRHGERSLMLPLRPSDVQRAFDETFARANAAARPLSTPSPLRGQSRDAMSASQTRYRLSRWPSRALFESKQDRLKIAACMMHRAMTLDEIAEASRVSRDVCGEFVETLLRAADGALTYETARSSVDADTPTRAGANGIRAVRSDRLSFVARIRARLGL